MRTPWTKPKSPRPDAAPAPQVVLPADQLAAVRAEAAAVMRVVGRAEAKAQATIRLKETVAKLEAMLARERGESNRKLATMANELNKMMVIVSVLQDLAITAARMEWNGLSDEQRRAEFGKLCTLKQVRMAAVEGTA